MSLAHVDDHLTTLKHAVHIVI